MKVHALRSTFINMALEDGADDRLVEVTTEFRGSGGVEPTARVDQHAASAGDGCRALPRPRSPPRYFTTSSVAGAFVRKFASM